MYQTLGMVLMEDLEGRVSIELFENPSKGKELFEDLKGRPTDKPSRATFLDLSWETGEVKMDFRNLPVLPDLSKQPWCHRLGVGPVDEPLEE